MKSKWAWVALLVVLVSALFIGSQTGTKQTVASRVDSISKEVRCPVCESESVADSQANAAKAVKAEIRRRVLLGQSSADIKGYLASRYGNDILLEPTNSGLSWIVWVAPAVMIVFAAGFVVIRMNEWKSSNEVSA